MRNFLLRSCMLLVSIGYLLTPQVAFLQNDLLDKTFQPSKDLNHVINIGNNKNAVGNEIFRGSTDINLSTGISERAPLIVRITQTLLRFTIILALPMLIRVGVKIIKSGMEGADIKDSLKQVSGVLLGLILALSAVGIIYLIQSIAMNSLTL